MDAEVSNNSVGRNQDLHYVMELEHKDKYDLTLDGTVRGLMSNMDIKTKIVYKAKARRVLS